MEPEDPEVIEISERAREGRRLRKASGHEPGRNRLNNEATEEGTLKFESNYLTTPSQMSEISSIVESINTNEDGEQNVEDL